MDTNTMSVWDHWREQNRERSRYRKTLEGIGLPEFWVDFWVPKEVTPAELADMEQRAAEKHRIWVQKCVEQALLKLAVVAEPSLPSDTAAVVSQALDANPAPRPLRMQEVAILGVGSLIMIRDWNLTDPKTGEKLPLPSVDDLDQAAATFAALPFPVLYEIKKGAEEAGEQVIPLEMRELTFGQRLKAIDSVLRTG